MLEYRKSHLKKILCHFNLWVMALFIALLAVSNHASAATITVQSNNDDATKDASRCPGTACRLRDAVEAAASGDTINFGSDMTINIPSTPLQIISKNNLTIDGTGRNVTIYGNSDHCTTWDCWEMIDIMASSVTLNHLTFSSGGDKSSYPNTPVRDGGALAINGQSTLTITNSTFTNNSGKLGGAITSAGIVTIINSNFSGNRAWQGGGAINNGGTLTITGSTFSGNQYAMANSSAPTVYGGAIRNTGTLNVADSTFAGQSLPISGWMYDTKGGGIYNSGTADVTRSTFTGNSATYGGGIFNAGTLRLTNSTFSSNTANGGGSVNGGGGLYHQSGTADVLSNTFVASFGANIASGTSGQLSQFINNIVANSISSNNCSLTFPAVASYNNLSNDPGDGCGTGVTQSSMLLLGTIGNYGGNTTTIPLLPGSAAINTGNDTDCASVDQRGFTRNQGSHCDIGAFESRGFTLGSATGASQRTEINTAFAEPLGLTVTSTAGDPVDGGQVTLTAPASGASIATTPMAATIAGGKISAHVTANGTAGGPYNVTAMTRGASPSVNFSLKNTAVGTNTVTSLSSDINPALPGQTIVFTAKMTSGAGTPTGTVAFKDNGGVITGCSSQTLSGGNAVCSTSSLSIGNHTNITAVYSGSTTFNPSTSTPYSQTVKYNSAATVVSSPNPSYGLDAVVLTATITSTTGTPTGTVTFYDNGSAIGSGTLDAGGKATMSISSLLGGTHLVTATYGGDASYLGSTSTATSHTVNQAATTISLSSAPNPSVRGQQVIFTATVTGSGSTPGSGTVAFKNNGVDIAGCSARVVNASGQTTCSTSVLGLGTYSNITTVYSGSTNFFGSTSEPYSHTVNACIPTIVTNNNDSGEGSLRAALDKMCVAFSSDMTITLASTLVIANNLTIDGAGHSITVSGNNAMHVISINPGVTLNLNNLTVANGKIIDGSGSGGGIYNNQGTLNVTNSTFTGNSAKYSGGGISNYKGTLNVTDSTFTGNSATSSYGGGIYDYQGTLNVTNSTFTGNSAVMGGGIYKYAGTATLTNCTVTGNSSGYRLNYASVAFNNTIVANSTGGVNCNNTSDSTSSGANNLSSDASCGAAFTQSSSILLGGLGSYEGSTQTIPLLPGSSALDAGNTATCTATDQRGKSRIGTCDIGAFESQGFTLTATGGNNQSTLISTSFANPLQVTLSESGGNPLPGAGISYSAPDSGSSASIVGSPATTDAAGIAVVSATANDITGSYAVIASATNDANIKASLSLTNIHGYTVIYNGNGGSGTMIDAGSPYLSGATVTVLANTFTRSGYSFTGWNTAADGLGTTYAAGATYSINADVTLYAKWTTSVYNGDAQLSVTPSDYLFGVVDTTDCSSSPMIPFTITNNNASTQTLATLSFGGVNADQFVFTSDNCSGQTIATNGTCTATIKFCPTTSGSKGAMLNIPLAGVATPVLTALLHNHESTDEEARRRVPPVISTLGVPANMTKNVEYTLTWSLLGYDYSYQSLIAFFDCTGISDGSCGDSYGSNFAASAYLQPNSTEAGTWNYNGIASNKFNYSYTFTAPASAKDIVIRFYGKSAADAASGKAGLSSLIPGNQPTAYYDQSGRRILIHIVD